MPLINIPSKSARRGTREPELHPAKGRGWGWAGTRRRRGGSRRNIIGTTLSPLSAESAHRAGKNPRGRILHFAPAFPSPPPPSPRRGGVESALRVRPSRGGSWILAAPRAPPILISARWSRSRLAKDSPFAGSTKNREGVKARDLIKLTLPEGTKRPHPTERSRLCSDEQRGYEWRERERERVDAVI